MPLKEIVFFSMIINILNHTTTHTHIIFIINKFNNDQIEWTKHSELEEGKNAQFDCIRVEEPERKKSIYF